MVTRSRLENALDAISDQWESLVPYEQPSRRFKRLTTVKTLSGVSAHRTFFFQDIKGGYESAFGDEIMRIDYSFVARVRLQGLPENIATIPVFVASHAKQLMRAANTISDLGEGVRKIHAKEFLVEPIEEQTAEGSQVLPNDIELVIVFDVSVEEIN